MSFWSPCDDACVTPADRVSARLFLMANERHKIVDQDKKDTHGACEYLLKARGDRQALQ